MISKALGKMIDYFGEDVRRINHALKVFGYVKAISRGQLLNKEEKMVAELSGVLHDIGIKEAERKYQSSSGKYQEIEGPPIAKTILKDIGIDNCIIERVCYLIGNHHSYSKIDGLDFQILVEADFLVNIDEDAMEREAVRSIKDKYFRTDAGRNILKNSYGV